MISPPCRVTAFARQVAAVAARRAKARIIAAFIDHSVERFGRAGTRSEYSLSASDMQASIGRHRLAIATHLQRRYNAGPRRTAVRREQTPNRFIRVLAGIVFFSSAGCRGQVVPRAEKVEAPPTAPGHYECSIDHGGLRRSYRIHIPPSFDRTKPTPLVLALHGGGGSGWHMERLTLGGFNTLSDKEGFIVVYPDGIERHWNDGRLKVKYRTHKEKIDDVGFLSALRPEIRICSAISEKV